MMPDPKMTKPDEAERPVGSSQKPPPDKQFERLINMFITRKKVIRKRLRKPVIKVSNKNRPGGSR